MSIQDRILNSIDQDRLVRTVIDVVNVPSPTGQEEPLARQFAEVLTDLGMQAVVQEVESGRANVLARLPGSEGSSTSLMYAGHLDTSYSGREPWLSGIRGFQPDAFEEDGRIYGLGVANMKGALCAFVEAIRALKDAGARLRGDLVFAGFAGEIEKAQWGEDFKGAEFRGYSSGARHMVANGGVTDVCILGEPTDHRLVLSHFGSMWVRISAAGAFVHTAWSSGREAENSIFRMQEILGVVREWLPDWCTEMAFEGLPAVANVGAMQGGFPWRVSRTPHRTDLFLDLRVPPDRPLSWPRARFFAFVQDLQRRFPDYGITAEVYVTAPGSTVAGDDPLVLAMADSHQVVFGQPAEEEIVHWASDASSLTRYGVRTLNYGTASGLPDPVKGENVQIEGLLKAAQVYALAATRICEVEQQ